MAAAALCPIPSRRRSVKPRPRALVAAKPSAEQEPERHRLAPPQPRRRAPSPPCTASSSSHPVAVARHGWEQCHHRRPSAPTTTLPRAPVAVEPAMETPIAAAPELLSAQRLPIYSLTERDVEPRRVRALDLAAPKTPCALALEPGNPPQRRAARDVVHGPALAFEPEHCDIASTSSSPPEPQPRRDAAVVPLLRATTPQPPLERVQGAPHRCAPSPATWTSPWPRRGQHRELFPEPRLRPPRAQHLGARTRRASTSTSRAEPLHQREPLHRAQLRPGRRHAATSPWPSSTRLPLRRRAFVVTKPLHRRRPSTTPPWPRQDIAMVTASAPVVVIVTPTTTSCSSYHGDRELPLLLAADHH